MNDQGMKVCANCAHKETCDNVPMFRKKQIPLTSTGCYSWKSAKVMTNGDRIRSMTDKELAHHLSNWICGKQLPCPHIDSPCGDCCERWLKQEAKEKNHD